jgi:DDE superfamily endonuclease
MSQKIKWSSRLKGSTPFRNKVTIDGTDFRIREPTNFDRKWFSHKFSGPGLRYEMGVCIATGHIVWIHGPFPCGSNPDIKIFRRGLKQVIRPGVERVEADAGYRGEPLYISTPRDFRNEREEIAKNHARARHEHVNRYLKHFGCLQQTYRHKLSKHANLFWAVAVVTQVSLRYQEKLIWQVQYTGQTHADNILL